MIEVTEAGRDVWLAPQAVTLIRQSHDSADRCDVMVGNGLMLKIDMKAEELARLVEGRGPKGRPPPPPPPPHR